MEIKHIAKTEFENMINFSKSRLVLETLQNRSSLTNFIFCLRYGRLPMSVQSVIRYEKLMRKANRNDGTNEPSRCLPESRPVNCVAAGIMFKDRCLRGNTYGL